jgi:hypothetical protein
MDTSDALPLIEALASGTDPISGNPLPKDSPLQHPMIVRALFTALRLLEGQTATPVRDPKSDTERPLRAGEAWDAEEDRKLTHAFHAGEPFTQLAKSHQRSRGAIVSRLTRLGEIEPTTASSATPHDTTQPDKALKKDRPQTGKPWTTEEDDRLRQLANSNLPNETIARELGRGLLGVEVRRSKFGIPEHQPPDDLPF